ncbi:MAG: hypothetical protein EHM25_10435 [Nitrosopumilales archaeon]|nr:MAG: hypothetical protein EHM25_10435 [Nitrosopumilales archaeon]
MDFPVYQFNRLYLDNRSVGNFSHDSLQYNAFLSQKIVSTMRQKWISGLLKNHHYVIYASKPDKAVAFETALLEDE